MGMQDDLSTFVIQIVSEAIRRFWEIGEGATETVAVRPKGYRYWDPETIRIDRELEEVYVQGLKGSRWRFILLSEELRRLDIEGEGMPLYALCDPFDGSALYCRHLRAFWFTAFALYDSHRKPIAAAVGDLLARRIEFCDGTGSFGISVGTQNARSPLCPNTTTELEEAYLATYLMKPHFLYPTVERFKPLLSRVKFIVPNGGPCGFADVAAGRVDIYLAVGQPMLEVFTGLPIAERSGCVVTTLDGKPVSFDPDINKRYDLVCACTPKLHRQLLEIVHQVGG